MSKVYFISDLHFGHDRILQFEPSLRPGTTVAEHDQILEDNWNSVVNKRDTVYCLGDVCMKKGDLEVFSRLKGNKVLIRGNHDTFPLGEYLKYFSNIFGITKYKGHWLSHAPIHPAELRDKKNIHGHVHSQSILSSLDWGKRDQRYINVSCEAINCTPIAFDDIVTGKYWEITKC